MTDKYLELISQGKDAYIEKAFNIGWFEYSSLTYENVEKKLKDIKDKNFFVYALTEVSFDAEGFEDADAYQSILSQLLEVTEILKKATLNCEFNVATNSIEISIHGERGVYNYSVDTEEHADWFDENVLEQFLNETVLQGEGCDLRFFVLPPCDQGANVVFVPDAMYEEAIDCGLIPQYMGYFMEDMLSEEEVQ